MSGYLSWATGLALPGSLSDCVGHILELSYHGTGKLGVYLQLCLSLVEGASGGGKAPALSSCPENRLSNHHTGPIGSALSSMRVERLRACGGSCQPTKKTPATASAGLMGYHTSHPLTNSSLTGAH